MLSADSVCNEMTEYCCVPWSSRPFQSGSRAENGAAGLLIWRSMPARLSAAVYSSMDHTMAGEDVEEAVCSEEERGVGSKMHSSRASCGFKACKETRGFLASQVSSRSPWWSASFSGCKSRWQILGAPHRLVWKSALLPRQQRERLFKRNILSFSLIRCSWRIGTLLLNCCCYGYQRLHQQPFPEALAPRIRSQLSPTSPLLTGGSCFIAASIISGLQMFSQPSRKILLKSLFFPSQTKTRPACRTCGMFAPNKFSVRGSFVPAACFYCCLVWHFISPLLVSFSWLFSTLGLFSLHSLILLFRPHSLLLQNFSLFFFFSQKNFTAGLAVLMSNYFLSTCCFVSS